MQPGAAGYSAFDPDTAAVFGLLTASNSYAGEADNSASGIANLDFAQPLGSNAEFSVEAWVKGNAQTQDAGIITKGYGNGGAAWPFCQPEYYCSSYLPIPLRNDLIAE
jgi:hypothetical protein